MARCGRTYWTSLRLMDYENEPYFKKYRRFFAHSLSCRSLNFCLRCGSTAIDSGVLGKIKCCSCGLVMQWDDSKFGVVRVYGMDEKLKPSQVSDFFHAMRLKKLGEL